MQVPKHTSKTCCFLGVFGERSYVRNPQGVLRTNFFSNYCRYSVLGIVKYFRNILSKQTCKATKQRTNFTQTTALTHLKNGLTSNLKQRLQEVVLHQPNLRWCFSVRKTKFCFRTLWASPLYIDFRYRKFFALLSLCYPGKKTSKATST